MKKNHILIILILALLLTSCNPANVGEIESSKTFVTTTSDISSDIVSQFSSNFVSSSVEVSETKNISSQEERISMKTSINNSKSGAATTSAPKNPPISTKFLDDYDKKKSSLVMDIGGWFSPYQTDAAFKEYADAGFTMVFLQGDNAGRIDDYEKVKEGLELSAKYGLKAYVWADFRSIRDGLEFTHDYSGFPAFAGLVYDEPAKTHIDNRLSPIVPRFNEMYPDDAMYVNLFPLRGTTVSGYDTYSAYIEATYSKILSKLKGPKWLTVDDYPIMEHNVTENGVMIKKKYINELWLKNIEYVAEFAKKHKELKTHFFIQSMGYGPNNRQPTEEDFRLQIYGLLAFGIDSFTHFCYFTPPVGFEFTEEQHAIINRDGSKSYLYNAAKKVNHEILNFSHVYFQFDWKGVYCLDAGERNNAFNNLSQTLNLASLKNIKNLSANEDVLVGYFQDDSDRPGFIVTNYNETSLNLTVKLKMEFKNATQVAVYKNGERKIYKITNNIYEIVLTAGEGAFVIPF